MCSICALIFRGEESIWCVSIHILWWRRVCVRHALYILSALVLSIHLLYWQQHVTSASCTLTRVCRYCRVYVSHLHAATVVCTYRLTLSLPLLQQDEEAPNLVGDHEGGGCSCSVVSECGSHNTDKRSRHGQHNGENRLCLHLVSDVSVVDQDMMDSRRGKHSGRPVLWFTFFCGLLEEQKKTWH